MRTAKDIAQQALGKNFGLSDFDRAVAAASFFAREIPEGAGNAKPTIHRLHHLFEHADSGPCMVCGRAEDDGVGIGGYTGRWRVTRDGEKVCIYCYGMLNSLAPLSLSDMQVLARGSA